MELSNCNSKVDEELLLEDLAPYLEYLKENDVQVWTGISNPRKQQFSMGQYMAIRRISRRISLKMDKLNNSGMYAKALKSSAFCEKPQFIYFYNQSLAL